MATTEMRRGSGAGPAPHRPGKPVPLLTLRYLLNGGLAKLAALFVGITRSAYRQTIIEPAGITAEFERFFAARVPGLSLAWLPDEQGGWGWRGICPLCTAHTFYVDPFTGFWACFRGGCPPRGTMAPQTLAVLLGEPGAAGAPELRRDLEGHLNGDPAPWVTAVDYARRQQGEN